MSIYTIIVSVISVVFVHEMGHAVAASALRLPWRFVLSKHGPGVRIGNDSLLLRPSQIIFTAAGGPFVNLMFAVVCFRIGQPLAAMMNIEFAVTNLLPFARSDGARILSSRPGSA